MASLYTSIFPYIYVQPHPLFRYKKIHTLGVSETQILFWSVLGVILVEMHIYLALVISTEGGPVQGQIAFHEHVMCVPGSSAERYWPHLDPGTVLCLFSTSGRLSPSPLSASANRTFCIRQAELQLTSACLLEMNPCNQMKMGSVSSGQTTLH